MIDALQHFEKHGEVCPANWKQGAPTIKPGVKESKEYFEKVGEEVRSVSRDAESAERRARAEPCASAPPTPRRG